jgi:hypothetical protein
MHTPRMNYRQSMSLNEAVMEAMHGKPSDSKIKADLEKLSDKELKDTKKVLRAMVDNQEMISKAAIETAEEEGLMDMEEEAGAMGGGRGGAAAPPAGGAARMGGMFGGSRPTGTRPGKGPDISKKQKKKKPFKLPKLPDLPEILPFDVDPDFLDKLFKKLSKGLSDTTGIPELDEKVTDFIKKYVFGAIPELAVVNRILSIADKIDKDKDPEGGNQPG